MKSPCSLLIPDLARRGGLLAMLVGASLGGAGCGQREVAPQFSYTVLAGSQRNSAALHGKVVLVNFWATSCAICVHEMPQIVATHRKYSPRGYETLAVAMRDDPPALVSSFAQSRQLPFAVVIDNTGAIAQAFASVSATPTSVLIDKRGAIVKTFVGEPDFDELHALVEKLLAEV